MSPRRTARVRIAVAVSAAGHWSAAGWGWPNAPRQGDEATGAALDAAADLADLIGGHDGSPRGLVWVEAEIPLPEKLETIVQGISGPVEEANHVG